jgi:hypothetical protein
VGVLGEYLRHLCYTLGGKASVVCMYVRSALMTLDAHVTAETQRLSCLIKIIVSIFSTALFMPLDRNTMGKLNHNKSYEPISDRRDSKINAIHYKRNTMAFQNSSQPNMPQGVSQDKRR